MMDAELKNKWVAALRSGHYEQGKDHLRTIDDKFCCLGVLCDVVNPDGWTRNDAGASFVFHYNGGSSSGILPAALKQELWRDGLSEMGTLITMNDYGRSFNEIADYIEEEL